MVLSCLFRKHHDHHAHYVRSGDKAAYTKKHSIQAVHSRWQIQTGKNGLPALV